MDTEAILGLLKETAAEVITPRFHQLAADEIVEKRPGDLVTIADREAEQRIGARLADAFPSAVIVGEEAVFSDPGLLSALAGADHAFVIDPIDGTRNFVRGRDEHGVMVAETRGGITTRGWIWQPMTGRAYVVERGSGVRLNDGAVTRAQHDRAPLGASSKKRLVGYDADGHLSPAVLSHFCCAFDYPAVLHGDIDFMAYTSMHPWDHLAGSLMITEHGGVSRTVEGLAYTPTSRGKGLIIAGDTVSWMAAQQYWPVA
ncbi:inositol monophosphatase family protein [Tessaracoccus lacteus]|uniref:Inositol monophosphatase n=1 Tax=Tessaracoccus lacteus TaxID=3041766 RepID=A0ABY8Q0Y1_9ACTN|nr:inositol monophosphatase [Tessaracoccus sp. T21]WGT48236.1 inositol monophosphatase [Tessaracoccus sp. T21]